MTTTKPPKNPSDPRDPAGVDAIERAAMRAAAWRVRRAGAAVKRAVRRVPVLPTVNRRYAFDLDRFVLDRLLRDIEREIDAQLLEGGPDDLWLSEGFVEVAAARGTAQEFANLAAQSPAYSAARRSDATILQTAAYQRRLALTRARVYEEMRGLSAGMKSDLARVITDGLARGQAPLVIAKRIQEETNISASRARRIARTEVGTALKRARWDEAEEAAEELNLRTLQLHLSALSPTTRKSHASRHGQLYTVEQCREFFSRDGNSVNCKCTTVAVLVDSKNQPIVKSVIAKAKKTRQTMEDRGYMWSK